MSARVCILLYSQTQNKVQVLFCFIMTANIWSDDNNTYQWKGEKILFTVVYWFPTWKNYDKHGTNFKKWHYIPCFAKLSQIFKHGFEASVVLIAPIVAGFERVDFFCDVINCWRHEENKVQSVKNREYGPVMLCCQTTDNGRWKHQALWQSHF